MTSNWKDRWTEADSDKYKRKYWWNIETRETNWFDPNGFQSEEEYIKAEADAQAPARTALTDLPVKTLTDLPDFIFLDHMIEYLDIGAVGALIMVSSMLRDIFDKNEEEIWKILYLRTLPYKILDTSIHIGEHDQSLSHAHLS